MVTVRAIDGIGPLEAIDGTPIVASSRCSEAHGKLRGAQDGKNKRGCFLWEAQDGHVALPYLTAPAARPHSSASLSQASSEFQLVRSWSTKLPFFA